MKRAPSLITWGGLAETLLVSLTPQYNSLQFQNSQAKVTLQGRKAPDQREISLTIGSGLV